tara:strand:- start:75 stop:716 length:642 start_codon:yes stop_codon:yes gene_type:complete
MAPDGWAVMILPSVNILKAMKIDCLLAHPFDSLIATWQMRASPLATRRQRLFIGGPARPLFIWRHHMAKPEWGTKRACPECGAKFYDFQKGNPLTCPACGAGFNPELLLRSRRSRIAEIEEEEVDDEDVVATPKDEDDEEEPSDIKEISAEDAIIPVVSGDDDDDDDDDGDINVTEGDDDLDDEDVLLDDDEEDIDVDVDIDVDDGDEVVVEK